MATRTRKTTFALLNKELTHIENLYRLDDVPPDTNKLRLAVVCNIAMEYGARFVWLPSGGKVGEEVTVDDRGEATVVRRRSRR